MANHLPPPPREFSWARVLRTLSFWALVIVGAIALVQFAAGRREPTAELNYTQFSEQLDSGNIKSLEIVGRQEIRGDFQRPITAQGKSAPHFTVMLPFETDPTWVNGVRSKGVDITGKEPKPGIGVIILNLWPVILIGGLIIFMLRQMQQGGNRAFAFGKSKAKLLSGDTPKITFADVAGCDEAKQELEEIIDFLKDPQKFQRLGGRLPKGALLVGPPGTGKTLLAKAVAGEAGRPFFSMSGSDFVEMFVGVGASRVRDLFEQGKKNAPCIIFIDEIDAVGRHRGSGLGGGHDEREQTLNQLLVEMDGFESNDGVILVAATNRPDVLDPALLRPGRFDRRVVVDLPDLKGREGILRVHTRNIPLAEDVDTNVIARGTPGFSGADLANLVNEAALNAARYDKKKVQMVDFEFAKDKVLMGVERKSMVMSDREKRNTAYHESGHTIVAAIMPAADPLHKVTIIPRGRALGLTQQLPTEDKYSYSKRYLDAMLAVLMGGRIAEEVFIGEITTGAGNDIERATGMARRMVCEWGMSDLGPATFGKKEEAIFLGREFAQHQDYSEATAIEIDKEVRRILDRAYKTSHEIISNNKQSLDKIARKLLERETLEGWEVNDVLREDTGIDYIKMKEYYPEEAPGEKMTIAPGSGPSTDVPLQ